MTSQPGRGIRRQGHKPLKWRIAFDWRGSGRKRRQWFKLTSAHGDAVGPGGGVRYWRTRTEAKAALDAELGRAQPADPLLEDDWTATSERELWK